MEYKHIDNGLAQQSHLRALYMQESEKLLGHEAEVSCMQRLIADGLEGVPIEPAQEGFDTQSKKVQAIADILGKDVPDTADRDKSWIQSYQARLESEHAVHALRAEHPELYDPITTVGEGIQISSVDHAKLQMQALDARHAWTVEKLEEKPVKRTRKKSA
jgi:hypothetical protein